ncbi:MAG: alpha/beta fold hydrolase [Oscillospiraceae bacterium]|nr:alpha/beta fold hydrolase [Oscillospiraceae bacterium]
MKNQSGNVAIGTAKMEYVSFGRGDHTLIILPGLSDGLATVKGKAWILSLNYRMFFTRYRVYIFSRKEPLPMENSIRQMADDQATAMRMLGIRKASVLGVSQGGMIALSLAAEYPDLVENLILAVTAPFANDTVRSCVRDWMESAERGNHRELMIQTAEKSYSSAYLKRYRRYYPLLGFIGKPKTYTRFMANAQAILQFDMRDELERITCPALIIGGDEDRIVGIQASYELHKGIKDSRLVVYAGLGHAAYEEASDFNPRILSFLEGQAVPEPVICLVRPAREDLWFRQMLLSDAKTMSYNDAWGGTIPFQPDQWEAWSDRWLSSDESSRFYRYLRDESSGALIGEVSCRRDPDRDIWLCDIIIAAWERNRGYGTIGLRLLCEEAKRHGIHAVHDEIAANNPSIDLFIREGFHEQSRTETAVLLKKKLF